MKILNRLKKVLIVEDDASLRSAVEEKLSAVGYRVRIAIDGQEGLRVAIEEKPHLILLDLMLPKMDGLSLLKELRRDSWGQDVPVIVITVLSETDARREEAKALGAFAYIDKSRYTLEDVLEKVKEGLSA